jgi:hypothetical protein
MAFSYEIAYKTSLTLDLAKHALRKEEHPAPTQDGFIVALVEASKCAMWLISLMVGQ